MHYKDEELYFFLKEGAKDPEVNTHLAQCAECSRKTAYLKILSGLFAASMENPPPLRLRPVSAKSRRLAFSGFLKPVFAVSLSIMIMFSGAILIKKFSMDKETGQEVPAFVYETYSTIYDFDYYKTNYIDKTKINYDGGLQNEAF
jgi:hypothetical protein